MNASHYYRQDGHPNQVFCVRYRESYRGIRFYSLQAVNSGKYLDICGSSPASGANVHQYQWNGGANQLFCFLKNDAGALIVKSKVGDLVLDINGAALRSGANVQAWSYNGSRAQQWKLQKWDYEAAPRITGNPNARIANRYIGTYVANVANASKVSYSRSNGRISVSCDRTGCGSHRFYAKGISNGSSGLTIKAYNKTWGWRSGRLGNLWVSVGPCLRPGCRLVSRAWAAPRLKPGLIPHDAGGEVKPIWLCVPRGALEDFDCDEVLGPHESAEALWLERYSDACSFYELVLCADDTFRSVSVDRVNVVCTDPGRRDAGPDWRDGYRVEFLRHLRGSGEHGDARSGSLQRLHRSGAALLAPLWRRGTQTRVGCRPGGACRRPREPSARDALRAQASRGGGRQRRARNRPPEGDGWQRLPARRAAGLARGKPE